MIKCCVCNAAKSRINVRFSKFPKPSNANDGNRRKHTKLQLDSWLKAINRSDIDVKKDVVCAKHFKSGRKAKPSDMQNIDWIPTLRMGVTKRKLEEKIKAVAAKKVKVEDNILAEKFQLKDLKIFLTDIKKCKVEGSCIEDNKEREIIGDVKVEEVQKKKVDAPLKKNVGNRRFSLHPKCNDKEEIRRTTRSKSEENIHNKGGPSKFPTRRIKNESSDQNVPKTQSSIRPLGKTKKISETVTIEDERYEITILEDEEDVKRKTNEDLQKSQMKVSPKNSCPRQKSNEKAEKTVKDEVESGKTKEEKSENLRFEKVEQSKTRNLPSKKTIKNEEKEKKIKKTKTTAQNMPSKLILPSEKEENSTKNIAKDIPRQPKRKVMEDEVAEEKKTVKETKASSAKPPKSASSKNIPKRAQEKLNDNVEKSTNKEDEIKITAKLEEKCPKSTAMSKKQEKTLENDTLEVNNPKKIWLRRKLGKAEQDNRIQKDVKEEANKNASQDLPKRPPSRSILEEKKVKENEENPRQELPSTLGLNEEVPKKKFELRSHEPKKIANEATKSSSEKKKEEQTENVSKNSTPNKILPKRKSANNAETVISEKAEKKTVIVEVEPIPQVSQENSNKQKEKKTQSFEVRKDGNCAEVEKDTKIDENQKQKEVAEQNSEEKGSHSKTTDDAFPKTVEKSELNKTPVQVQNIEKSEKCPVKKYPQRRKSIHHSSIENVEEPKETSKVESIIERKGKKENIENCSNQLKPILQQNSPETLITTPPEVTVESNNKITQPPQAVAKCTSANCEFNPKEKCKKFPTRRSSTCKQCECFPQTLLDSMGVLKLDDEDKVLELTTRTAKKEQNMIYIERVIRSSISGVDILPLLMSADETIAEVTPSRSLPSSEDSESVTEDTSSQCEEGKSNKRFKSKKIKRRLNTRVPLTPSKNDKDPQHDPITIDSNDSFLEIEVVKEIDRKEEVETVPMRSLRSNRMEPVLIEVPVESKKGRPRPNTTRIPGITILSKENEEKTEAGKKPTLDEKHENVIGKRKKEIEILENIETKARNELISLSKNDEIVEESSRNLRRRTLNLIAQTVQVLKDTDFGAASPEKNKKIETRRPSTRSQSLENKKRDEKLKLTKQMVTRSLSLDGEKKNVLEKNEIETNINKSQLSTKNVQDGRKKRKRSSHIQTLQHAINSSEVLSRTRASETSAFKKYLEEKEQLNENLESRIKKLRKRRASVPASVMESRLKEGEDDVEKTEKEKSLFELLEDWNDISIAPNLAEKKIVATLPEDPIPTPSHTLAAGTSTNNLNVSLEAETSANQQLSTLKGVEGSVENPVMVVQIEQSQCSNEELKGPKEIAVETQELPLEEVVAERLKCTLCLIGKDEVIETDDYIEEILNQHFKEEEDFCRTRYVCVECWQEIDNFNKFYLSIKTAHSNFKKQQEQEKKITILEDIKIKSIEEALFEKYPSKLCEVCYEVPFTSFDHMIDHYQFHNSDNRLFCCHCTSLFACDKKSFIEHLQTHEHKSPETPQLAEDEYVVEEFLEKTFVCQVCGQAFPLRPLLTDHLLHEHNKQKVLEDINKTLEVKGNSELSVFKNYPKKTCHLSEKCGHNEMFEDFDQMDRHYKKEHGLRMTYECMLCMLSFGRKSTFLAHIQKEASTNKLGISEKPTPSDIIIEYIIKCDKCGKYRPVDHECITELPKNDDDTGICPSCGLFVCNYNTHVRSCKTDDSASQSDGNERRIKCLACSKSFYSLETFNLHNQRHHATGNCSDCGHYYRKYEKHKRVTVLSGAYKCEICLTECKSECEYMEHKEQHTEAELVQCRHCSRKFYNKAAADNHERIVHHVRKHDKVAEKPEENKTDAAVDLEMYKCGQCSKKFKSLYFLAKHQVAHSAITVDHVPCDICKTPVHQSYLETHKLVSHGGECDKCGQYYGRNLMKHHMHCKQKEKKHKCKICNKKLTSYVTLRRHMSKHTGDKMTGCQFCGKEFYLPMYTKRHEMSVHKSEYEAKYGTRKRFGINIDDIISENSSEIMGSIPDSIITTSDDMDMYFSGEDFALTDAEMEPYLNDAIAYLQQESATILNSPRWDRHA